MDKQVIWKVLSVLLMVCIHFKLSVNPLTSLAIPHPVSGLHMFPSPRRPRARCASGARSPLAPTEPCSGTNDKHDSEIWYGEFGEIKVINNNDIFITLHACS